MPIVNSGPGEPVGAIPGGRWREALLESGALQRAILNSATVSCIATDADGLIRMFSVGAARMLGYAADDLTNTVPLIDLVDPEEVVARAGAICDELGTAMPVGFEALVCKASRLEDRYELTCLRKDGSRLSTVVAITALRSTPEAVSGYLMILTAALAAAPLPERVPTGLEELGVPVPRFDGILHPARILIVDDQRQDRRILEAMLASEGHTIESATSGTEALALVAQHPPDLILLDIMMPAMDGYQVATALKNDPASKHIPVIMVTAVADRESRINGLRAGAEDFLSKPVNPAELCARVANLLRLKAYGEYYDRYSQALEAEVARRIAELGQRTALLEQQAALLDLTQDAIVVQDMQGHILFWSRGAEVMTGWLQHEAVGRLTHDLLQTTLPAPLPEIEATLLRLGLWEGEVTHQTRAGASLMVSSRWAVQRDPTGTPVRILSISTDISSRKHADAERLLLAERLALATEVARVGVWEWDLASHTLTWDPAMFAIYGLPHAAPLPYEAWSNAIHPDDLPAVEAVLRQAIETKGSSAVEFRIGSRTGEGIRTISTRARVILDAHSMVRRVIGVDTDVTDRRAAEQALEHSRTAQLRFKDEFLSHVSHELRSPLTAIKQFTTILAGGLAGELSGEQLQYEQIVMKNVLQLQAMIDDLLEVTRLETGKLTVDPERLSVADAVTDATNTVGFTARVKRIALARDLAADLPSAYADRTRLRQILIILLDNAIKFTGEGGAITVAARGLARDPAFLVLSVSDSGCGVSPEIAAKIFDRLYQDGASPPASRKGLGLGLFICKGLVTRQGGEIWLESTLGIGSTFFFTLPVFDSAAAAPPLEADREDLRGRAG